MFHSQSLLGSKGLQQNIQRMQPKDSHFHRSQKTTELSPKQLHFKFVKRTGSSSAQSSKKAKLQSKCVDKVGSRLGDATVTNTQLCCFYINLYISFNQFN